MALCTPKRSVKFSEKARAMSSRGGGDLTREFAP